jgi:TIR domain
MSQKIFISYRRADTADFTVALYNELCKHFQEDRLFKDINNIAPGMEFGHVLNGALDQAVVVLAVIGPEYISGSGARLFDPADWVRQELAVSLQRGLRVVPILANGAELPTEAQLPPELHPLRKRQVARIDNQSFQYDVATLANAIRDLIPAKPRPAPPATSTLDNAFKAILLLLMLFSIGLIAYAWIFSQDEMMEKLIMSLFGGVGIMGGWAAFSRQRWIEYRSTQIT